MRLGSTARRVANLHDEDSVALDPITHQIGLDKCDLSTAVRDRAPAIGMIAEAFTDRQKLLAKTLSREGFRFTGDVSDDRFNVGESAVGPDYFRHEYGVGSWLGVPRDFSHSTTRSCGTTRPAAMSASASAIAWRSASSSNSSKMSGSGLAMPYDSRNLSRTNPEKPSSRPSSRSVS